MGTPGRPSSGRFSTPLGIAGQRGFGRLERGKEAPLYPFPVEPLAGVSVRDDAQSATTIQELRSEVSPRSNFRPPAQRPLRLLMYQPSLPGLT